MKMNSKEIIKLLPYQDPFLFVDELTQISKDSIVGNYTFKKDEYFYQGHFKNSPVTPGVILIEVMAQIGVVCFGINLLKEQVLKNEIPQIALTSSNVDFLKPIFPGEFVEVKSQKEYFRFNKLKCKVKLYNKKGMLACSGIISGMINQLGNE